VGDVRQIWENTGWNHRVEEQGLRALGGNRVKQLRLENVRQIFAKTEGIRRESGGGRETEVMLDGFRVRNGFRERLVTKLKEREYHGRKAGGGHFREGVGM